MILLPPILVMNYDELQEQLPVDWEIETTSRTFLASVKTTDGQKRMYIREDGRVWEESAK